MQTSQAIEIKMRFFFHSHFTILNASSRLVRRRVHTLTYNIFEPIIREVWDAYPLTINLYNEPRSNKETGGESCADSCRLRDN